MATFNRHDAIRDVAHTTTRHMQVRRAGGREQRGKVEEVKRMKDAMKLHLAIADWDFELGCWDWDCLQHFSTKNTPCEAILARDEDAADRVDIFENTVLHWAAFYGKLAAVKWLLDEARVQLDQRNVFGDTALHSACAEGEKEIIGLLLERSADPHARNLSAQTPLDYAASRNVDVAVFKRMRDQQTFSASTKQAQSTFLAIKTTCTCSFGKGSYVLLPPPQPASSSEIEGSLLLDQVQMRLNSLIRTLDNAHKTGRRRRNRSRSRDRNQKQQFPGPQGMEEHEEQGKEKICFVKHNFNPSPWWRDLWQGKQPLQFSHAASVLVLPSLFTAAICKRIVALAEGKIQADSPTVADSVDGQPEWQHTITDLSRGPAPGPGICDEVLAPLVRILSVHLIPILLSMLDERRGPSEGQQRLHLECHWAFIRCYSPARRQAFVAHRDSSIITCNIMLSIPPPLDDDETQRECDFTGGELYVLRRELLGADILTEEQFRQVLPRCHLVMPSVDTITSGDIDMRKCEGDSASNVGGCESSLFGNLTNHHDGGFGVRASQGDCVVHEGGEVHGVLPVTGGHRHVLILMFQYVPGPVPDICACDASTYQ